jgi:predicted pyridoxine 5'-phosphate oxidase superfamily flavin-nucleotide-binding protein
MQRLDDFMKLALRTNICYLATCSKDGIPNVVPVGLVEVLDDSTIAIVDVLMNKTRKNLAENDNVALAVTDVNRLVGYQFKGKAYAVSEGEIMEWAKEFVKRKQEKRRELLANRLKTETNPELISKIKKLMEVEYKPKAVVLIKVNEVYRTM